MRELSERLLWMGFVASVLIGVLVRGVQLWAPGGPQWPVAQVLLDVIFWFSMTSAVVLALLALRIGVLVAPGGKRRARPALLVGLAVAIGLVFMMSVATYNWAIFVSPASIPTLGFASLIADAAFGLLKVSAGSLIALATLTLLTSEDSPDPKDEASSE